MKNNRNESESLASFNTQCIHIVSSVDKLDYYLKYKISVQVENIGGGRVLFAGYIVRRAFCIFKKL